MDTLHGGFVMVGGAEPIRNNDIVNLPFRSQHLSGKIMRGVQSADVGPQDAAYLSERGSGSDYPYFVGGVYGHPPCDSPCSNMGVMSRNHGLAYKVHMRW